MVNDSVKITIQGRQYDVAYPNVGQYYDIAALKQRLSNGEYGNLLRANTDAAFNSLDMIDVEATLTILCPGLIEDLKAPIGKLGIRDFVEIRDSYIEHIQPMFIEIKELLNPKAKVKASAKK